MGGNGTLGGRCDVIFRLAHREQMVAHRQEAAYRYGRMVFAESGSERLHGIWPH